MATETGNTILLDCSESAGSHDGYNMTFTDGDENTRFFGNISTIFALIMTTHKPPTVGEKYRITVEKL